MAIRRKQARIGGRLIGALRLLGDDLEYFLVAIVALAAAVYLCSFLPPQVRP